MHTYTVVSVCSTCSIRRWQTRGVSYRTTQLHINNWRFSSILRNSSPSRKYPHKSWVRSCNSSKEWLLLRRHHLQCPRSRRNPPPTTTLLALHSRQTMATWVMHPVRSPIYHRSHPVRSPIYHRSHPVELRQTRTGQHLPLLPSRLLNIHLSGISRPNHRSVRQRRHHFP